MKKSKQLDSIVETYISTDWELADIVGSASGSSRPIVSAMSLLCQCIKGAQTANGAFLAAKNVDINTYDSDICILFLVCWAHASYLQSSVISEKLPESWALIQRARNMITSNTPPELICAINIIEAHLVSLEGNHDKEELIFSDSLKLLNKNSTRKKHIILEFASSLAQAGRLKDIETQLNSITEFNENFKKTWVTAVRFINSIETGNLTHAANLVSEITQSDFDTMPLRNFQKYKIILDIMAAPNLNLTINENQDLDSGNSPDWSMVLKCLLSNKIHQALRWARICENKQQLYVTSREFISFNLLRAELAESNIEAARRIMDIRNSRGNHHYLDSFFLSRIALLENNADSAADLFSSALKQVDQNEAHGRLLFELLISTDIRRDSLFNMLRAAERMNTPGPAKLKISKTEPSATSQHPHMTNTSEPHRIVASTSVMNKIMASVHHFAQVDVPVLITGETGTGKELIARALHDSGPRAKRPFVAINCGAISESLLESELFGHEKGAFSGAAAAHKGLFEEADNGSIFLDEVGEITSRLQVALLRVLETNEIRPVGSSQSRKISCRIIASTNADLQQLENDNRFRRDLTFRLRRLEIHLPALRERADDILLLATHFLNIGRQQDIYATMSARLAQKLIGHTWPGNVRELRNTVERMRLMNSDKLYYDADDLELTIDGSTGISTNTRDISETTDSNRSLPAQSSISSPKRIMKIGRSRVRRLTQLRDMFKEHKMLTRNEISQTFGISPNTATEDLKQLCAERYIEKVEPTASPRSIYFVLSESPYA